MPVSLAPYALIDVASLREYGGWPGSGQADRATWACNAATSAIERELGDRWLVTRGSTGFYFSPRQRVEVIRLPQFPCKTLASVHESTAFPRVYDSTTLLVDGTDYFYDAALGEIRRISGGSRTCWATGERGIKVVCTPGYTAPHAASDADGAYTRAEAATDLGELIGLALVMAAGLYKEGDTKAWGDSQAQGDPGSVTRALAYLSAAQLEQLHSYRRVEFGERTWEVVAA